MDRKATGRALNGLITLLLAAAAYSFMANGVLDTLEAGAGTTNTQLKIYGSGVIALSVAVPRAFLSMLPQPFTRDQRLLADFFAFVTAALVALIGPLGFGASWWTYGLGLATFLGLFVQDAITPSEPAKLQPANPTGVGLEKTA